MNFIERYYRNKITKEIILKFNCPIYKNEHLKDEIFPLKLLSANESREQTNLTIQILQKEDDDKVKTFIQIVSDQINDSIKKGYYDCLYQCPAHIRIRQRIAESLKELGYNVQDVEKDPFSLKISWE